MSAIDIQFLLNSSHYYYNKRLMTFFEFQERFNDEAKIISYYVQIRYNDKPCCNHCKSTKVYQRKDRLKVFE
jgi:hypothetical protein